MIDPEVVLQQILDDPNLVQHVSRIQCQGIETVTGYFRLTFAEGQQRQIIHFPFTPPLRLVPVVEAHATDQNDVRVRITDRQRFGVRAEVIHSRHKGLSQQILVEIIATETD